MEQKDYLMREIEKIGAMMRAILSRLFKLKNDPAITSELQFKQTNELMNNEISFDLDKFLTLDEEASKDYLEKFPGFSSGNIVLLAEVLYQSGITEQPEKKRLFLEKALMLYEYSCSLDKIFSLEREEKTRIIKTELEKI
jgi:hypothetical protein